MAKVKFVITALFSLQQEIKCKLKTKKANLLILGEEWLIWGLEWHDDKIRYHFNNVLQREIDLTEPPTCNHAYGTMYYKPQPMAFRFTHGNITSSKHRIPDSVTKSLFVDYIRVYQPADSQIIKPMYIPKKICDYGNGGGDNISVGYYLDVIYEWSSPAFDFVPKQMAILSHCFCEMQWIYTKMDITEGIYPVHLKTTLPNGSIENHVWQIEIE